jgi:uncharacterized membrane protein
MESTKRTLLKTASWETFHLVGVAGVIYLFTGEWEYASLGALLYIGWEALGYFLHERVWAKFGKGVKYCVSELLDLLLRHLVMNGAGTISMPQSGQ